METLTIAMFGEAEKGDYRTAYRCRSLPQLVETLGHPPEESRGLYYAVQALLYERELIFFRVREEGYSEQDYFTALNLLQREDLVNGIAAYCLPGVGDSEIIGAVTPLCEIYNSIMITNEPDLYDYLTHH